MAKVIPTSKPRLSSTKLREIIKIKGYDITPFPILIIGIRGYYLQTMGETSKNDRNLYDDAIFVLTSNSSTSFNGNTDPSRYGKRPDSNKGLASLKPGLWLAHRFGKHNASKPTAYDALIQTGDKVTVIRDGSPNTEETGYFGINIHRGGTKSTGSEGCQTLHPTQWDAFYQLVLVEAKRVYGNGYKTKTIPYLLLENVGDLI